MVGRPGHGTAIPPAISRRSWPVRAGPAGPVQGTRPTSSSVRGASAPCCAAVCTSRKQRSIRLPSKMEPAPPRRYTMSTATVALTPAFTHPARSRARCWRLGRRPRLPPCATSRRPRRRAALRRSARAARPGRSLAAWSDPRGAAGAIGKARRVLASSAKASSAARAIPIGTAADRRLHERDRGERVQALGPRRPVGLHIHAVGGRHRSRSSSSSRGCRSRAGR